MASSADKPEFVARIAPTLWREALDPTLRDVAGSGIQSIEVMLGESPFDPEIALTTAARIQRSAQDHGLRLRGLILPDSEFTIGASDSEKRAAGSRETLKAIELADKVGAEMVSLCPGAVRTAASGRLIDRYEDVFHQAVIELGDLRHDAARLGVRLACRVAHAAFLTSPLDVRDFLDRCNSPWIGARLNARAVGAIGVVEDWVQSLGHRLMVLELDDPLDGNQASQDPLLHAVAQNNQSAVISTPAA